MRLKHHYAMRRPNFVRDLLRWFCAPKHDHVQQYQINGPNRGRHFLLR